jgi:hypothetical protein
MKTDERMAERIAHLERETKILKNEVQAVLVDLRDKVLEDKNSAPAGQAASQQIIVLQAPAASEARSDTEAHGSPEEKEGKDKTEELAEVSEAVKDKVEESAEVSEVVKDKAEEPEEASETAKDKAEESAGVSGVGRETHPGTAREEVTKAHIPEQVPGNARPSRDQFPGRDINLISVSGLVNWAEESVKKLGHQKTEAILEVAELMGLLSPQLKQIMTKLINIDSDDDSQAVSARGFLDSLVKITTLLGKDNQTEAALLSILSGEEDDHG